MMNPRILIDFEKSYNSYAYDKNTNSFFLDFQNHHSSLPLGYNAIALEHHGYMDEVLRVSALKCSNNQYDSDERREFVQEFKSFAVPATFTHLHFCSTGSVAVEAAVKTVWWQAPNEQKSILVLKNDNHGHTGFGNFLTDRHIAGSILSGIPELPWIINVKGQNILKNLATDEFAEEIAAVLIEPVQAAAGDLFIEKRILQEIRNICTQKNIPLIFDEVETGFGATGNIWYFQHLGIEPDIVIFGKKAQVSGIMVREKFGDIFNYPDKLSDTYDGDLIDMIRCKWIIRAMKTFDCFKSIKEQFEKIKQGIESLSMVTDFRGIGGMISFDLATMSQREIFLQKAFQHKLLTGNARSITVHLRPNLMVTDTEAEEAIEIIQKIDKEM